MTKKWSDPQHIVRHVLAWTPQGKNFIALMDPAYLGDRTRVFDPAELASIEKRLPYVLAQYAASRMNHIPGSTVARNFDFWNGAPTQEIDNWVFFDIDDLGIDPHGQAFICFEGYSFDRTLDNTGMFFDSLTPGMPVKQKVNHSWLERRYPGWEERYLRAHALGYEGAELVSLVCNPAPEIVKDGAINLSGIDGLGQ